MEVLVAAQCGITIGSVVTAVCKSKVRSGVEADSAAAGELQPGELLTVVELGRNKAGQLRVRHARGWSSVATAGSGRQLLRLHTPAVAAAAAPVGVMNHLVHDLAGPVAPPIRAANNPAGAPSHDPDGLTDLTRRTAWGPNSAMDVSNAPGVAPDGLKLPPGIQPAPAAAAWVNPAATRQRDPAADGYADGVVLLNASGYSLRAGEPLAEDLDLGRLDALLVRY